MRICAAFLPTLLVAVIGCGSSADEAPPAPPPEPMDAKWPTLLKADWTMAGGMEGYVCARLTVTEDLFVAGFSAPPSPGVHHALLTIGVGDAPDGVGACAYDTVFGITAFGSGATTEPLAFPPGIATKIPKGAQLLLNIHISNTGQDEISGTTVTKALTIPESEVVERAELFAAMLQQVEIPARETKTHTGHCTVRSDATLVAVAPHMHTLGRHEKVVLENASGETTLLDAPFTFGEQTYSPLERVGLMTGDRLRVECTHENTTDELVTTGPTIRNEMCMATFYRYPIGGTTLCLND